MKIETITNRCTGCHACMNACLKKCIVMKPDKYGFLYPEINHNECVECGACEKACPLLNDKKLNAKGEAYGFVNRDKQEQRNSSSGGVFSLIARTVINNGGVVFGAAYDEEYNVCHTDVSDENSLKILRKSKYVQSRIGDSYRKAKKYLDEGRVVLFSGTPCQIGGLYSYLKKDYDNLITQDLVCHGVPSPLLWQNYLEYIKKIHNSELDADNPPDFRDKSNGWSNFGMFISFSNGDRIVEHRNKNLYMKAFLKNWCLRDTCYKCEYKSIERESDITLADFWGVSQVDAEIADNMGTSLVFVNSEKGRKTFEAVVCNGNYKKVDIEYAAKHNSAVLNSVNCPAKRNEFLGNITDVNFEKKVKKYIKDKKIRIFLSRAKRYVRNKLFKK